MNNLTSDLWLIIKNKRQCGQVTCTLQGEHFHSVILFVCGANRTTTGKYDTGHLYEFKSKSKQLTSSHLFGFAMPHFLYSEVASC